MAKIFPFRAYRYSENAGAPVALVTQPYDKITPKMRETYLAQSPYNLVRIILGQSTNADTAADNVYTRAAKYLKDWIQSAVLVQEKEPSLYAYFQEFRVPDTGEYLVRKGFIGLGEVEEYSANVVYRHEQTLSRPKKDRLDLLRATRAHCEQLFLLYPDPSGQIDNILDQAAAGKADCEVSDEYGAIHRIWRISEPAQIERIQKLMSDKKLIIADGHHRYETALAFRKENPGSVSASRVQMTFVNMHSSGLRILATHRLISDLPNFDEENFLRRTEQDFQVERIASIDTVTERWKQGAPGVFGVVLQGGSYIFTAKNPPKELDITLLHKLLIGSALGITEDQVREGKHLRYMRGIDSAVEEVLSKSAQIAFLVKPTSVQQVADVSFGGGVMPQKSTDFYPKLLSGLTIYKLDD